MNKPSKEQIEKWKSKVADPNTDPQDKETFSLLLRKFGEDVEEVVEKVGEEVVGKKERKPRTTKGVGATGKKPKGDDIEKAKAEIKKRTGKTEEECESIIEEYRSLRTKSQERKKKEAQASADNKERVEKLEKKGDIIEGTTEKTADAVIETAKEDVVEKIEKEIEKVEEKAEVEAKKEVEKEMPKASATEKKKEVAEKVEKKVKEKTKVVVKRVVVDTSALLTSIADALGKFDKDSQKEFLIKLRSDIDKLLSKYSAGGDVAGATQGYNITQSNLSSQSVNMFAGGGGVDGGVTIAGVPHKIEMDRDISELKLLGAKRIELSHPRGDVYALDNKGYVAIGYDLYSFDLKYLPKIKKAYHSGKYAGGGGVGENVKLYDVIAYKNASDYDNKKNAFVVADSYIRKVDAEDTLMKWRKTYPYIEIKEYMGNDPYKKYAGGGGVGEELMGGQPNSEPKPSGYFLVAKKRNSIIVESEESWGNKGSYELWVKNNGFSGYTLRYKGNEYEFAHEIENDEMQDFFAKGGMTEHGLRVGDTILSDGKKFGFPNEIEVRDEDKKRHLVNLNQGSRGLAFRRGGNTNSGRSWHLDRARHNKSENYEKAIGKRKLSRGGANIDMEIFKRRGM